MKHVWVFIILLCVSHWSFSQDKNRDVTNIDEGIQKPEISVFESYPNPVKEHLFVIGTYKIKRIEISDVSGKPVAMYQFDKSIIRLDVSELLSGIYIFKVTDENDRQAIKKLVVE